MADKYFFIDLDNSSEKRYEISKFFEYTDNFDPLTSFLYEQLKSLPMEGYILVQGEDGRPDLLSNRIYSDTQYWWILMTYNDLAKVEEIVNGMEIRYPSIESLENLYFSLKTNEQAINQI